MSYDFDEMSAEEVRDLLRKWRENNERRSEEIMDLWETVMHDDKFLQKMGSEKYLVLEQVIYAALDCHYYGMADLCIYTLSQEFPNSLRIKRYKAARLEAEEKYTEALALLDEIIAADETNAPARKRRVAILKAQGQIQEAIKELVDYLKKCMADVEAWQELCSLYVRAHELARAAFCAEELLLHQPHNHLLHQRLADIRYTMGGVENMELAKTYYCQAIKLNPDNIRALLGLFLVSTNLLSAYKSSGSGGKRAAAWKLCQWAQARLARAAQPPAPAGAPAGADASAPQPPLAQLMLSLAITD